MEAISDLPKPDDIDADYSPQYVKLARILRAEIEAGKHARGVLLPAVVLARAPARSARPHPPARPDPAQATRKTFTG